MEKIQNIDYNIILWDSTYGNTRLEIEISGEQINHVIVNTLRRTILTFIPIYAFSEFNFKKNTTIFNNNYIKLRIKNIPIWGIENKINMFVAEQKNNEIIDDEEIYNDDIDLTTDINNINSSTLKQFNMFVDYTSNEKDILTVTTDHAKFYYDEKRIDSPYKYPIPLVKLQSGQTITFTATSSLGIEKNNSIFSPVSVCFYKEVTPTKYIFCIESKGQINEKRIIEVGLINILDKLKKLPNILSTIEIDDKKDNGEIILMNEDSTFGNLLTYGLQSHKDIKFAGYNIPHLLEEKVIITYKTKNTKDILIILNDVIKYYITIFELLFEKNKKLKLN